MTPLKHTLAALLYISGSVLVAVAFITFMDADIRLGMMAGLIACLLGAEAHAGVSRRFERRKVQAELSDLSGAAAALANAVDTAGQRIIELEEKFERETTERMERIFSEIRVVESLVKRLAETRGFGGAGVRDQQASIAQEFAAPAKPRIDVADMNDSELLDTIRRSLEANRVDLYLQPIVSLPQRKIRYYEGLSRLRSESGALIMPRDYMRVAEPAGMMPAVDNILLFRCIQVVRKLASRNKDTGVFCNISAYSLLDSDFFPQFIEYMQHNKDLAQHLIFEFSQMTINGAGPIEEASLDALMKLGFRFSMDQVTSLKIDVAALAARNVRFIKVSAAMLVGDRDGNVGDIDRNDIKELFLRHGIQLIVDKVETEREVIDVLDLNVEHGQGYLFGEPRPVREEVLKVSEGASAAAA